MPDACLRINSPLVASQLMDGEVVMIHFETGCYYSTDRVGAQVLRLLERKPTLRQIVEAMMQRYASADRDAVAAQIASFIDELTAEKLVVADESLQPPGEVGLDADASDGFAAPVLHKYTDLEDLLLLDPIHDTDQQGWPAVKPADAAAEEPG